MRAVVVAMMLTCALPAFAAQTQLPAETKGDPKPDTLAAENFLKRQRFEDAIRQAKLALGRDERYVPAMVVLAKAYYYEKKYELATSIIDIAKSIDPNNAECYNLLGFIALTHDDRISATAAFKKATELDPRYGNAWDNLAAQYLFGKNYDGALEAAQKATQLLPQFPKAWNNLGSAHRGKLQYAESETAYKRATQLDPNYADAYFNLGILYLDAKQMPGTDLVTKLNTSINYLNKYKQLAGYRLTRDDPSDTYIAEARTGIEREQKRIERMQRMQQRGQPKAAPPPAGKSGGDK
ncbi:MAG TPA: tetratricopeptide repeat protein [Polyangia bacterium]|jgi:tetratricopeptide (TPR) repeat protein